MLLEKLSFQPVLAWQAMAAIAAVLVALLWVRPAFPGLTLQRHRWLVLLRLGVIGLALLAMLRPGCVSSVARKQSGQVYILADISRSMELPHRSDQSRRWDAMKEMLTANAAALTGLAEEQIEVVRTGFDGQLVLLEGPGVIEGLPEKPRGSETDIASALQAAVRGSRDKRLLGVILASDGVQNSAEMPVDLNDAIGGLVDREVPLFVVPFGLPAGIGTTADLAITNLPDHHTVAVKNRLGVRATLASRGFANQRLTVQLVLSQAGQAEQVIDTKFITPASAEEQTTVELNLVPEEVGQFRMAVRVLAMPGEVALRNNELTSFLTVEDGGLRVLLVAGNLVAEQTWLRQQVAAVAQGIDMQFVVIYPNTRDRWPLEGVITETLSDPTFDVIILLDVDSRALYRKGTHEANLKALEQHVGGGKGLMMMGGDHSFGPGLWHSTPLADVLPVLMSRTERQEFDQPVNRAAHIERPLQLVPVGNHFLTRLGDDPDQKTVWAKLPPMLCANRFAGLKDNAELLLESEAGEPVLVAGSYGAGRVVAFAGDSTWRWWLKGRQAEYKAFWRQVLYWLAFRDGQTNDLVRIEMPRRRFSPESEVTFSAEAWTANGQRIADAKFESWLESPAGKRSPVALSRSGERDWAELERGLIAEPGVYSVHVKATRNGTDIGATSREFSIADSDREIANPAADHNLLARLAAETSEHGGKVVQPEQFGDLLKELRESLPEMEVKIPVKWQLGQTAADGAAFLLLFVGLLATEWYLRKRWGLV